MVALSAMASLEWGAAIRPEATIVSYEGVDDEHEKDRPREKPRAEDQRPDEIGWRPRAVRTSIGRIRRQARAAPPRRRRRAGAVRVQAAGRSGQAIERARAVA